jgi:hypothetical protein
MIKNYGSFILEKWGSNDLSHDLSNFLIDKLNYNFGKLLLNREINISIEDYSEIKFKNSNIICKISNENYGAIDVNQIKIVNNEINNLEMILNIKISPLEKTIKKLNYDNKIISTIEHEFLHLIEIYYTMINDDNLSKSWKMGEELQKLKKKHNNKTWNDIQYFIYLMLPHEIRARIHQLDSEIKNEKLKSIDEINDFIIQSKIYKDLEFLSKLDYNKLSSELEIIQDFSINVLNKNENYEKEFKKFLKNIINKSKRLMKKMMKKRYNFLFEEQHDRNIDYDEWL